MSKEWVRVFENPVSPGSRHIVKDGVDGLPLQAYYTPDCIWRYVLPDSDGDGADELGKRIGNTLRLYRLLKN